MVRPGQGRCWRWRCTAAVLDPALAVAAIAVLAVLAVAGLEVAVPMVQLLQGEAEPITAGPGEGERSLPVPLPLPVAALARFAREGEVEPRLRRHLNRLSPADRQALRTAVIQNVPVPVMTATNALSTGLGQPTLQENP